MSQSLLIDSDIIDSLSAIVDTKVWISSFPVHLPILPPTHILSFLVIYVIVYPNAYERGVARNGITR